jgi:hypothetical protein
MQAMIDKVASECVAVRLRMLNRVITNIRDDAHGAGRRGIAAGVHRGGR